MHTRADLYTRYIDSLASADTYLDLARADINNARDPDDASALIRARRNYRYATTALENAISYQHRLAEHSSDD